MKIDFEKFDLKEFFGCVEATNTSQMKSNAFKTFRTYLQEKSFSKWSGDQLDYVGDYEDGKDFVDKNGIFYEMKGSLGLFNKNGSCKRVVLINKRPGKKKTTVLKKEDLKKTFEYMFLVDTENMSIGYTDWDTVEKRVYFTPSSPNAKVKFKPGDFKVLFTNIAPAPKSITAQQILDGVESIL